MSNDSLIIQKRGDDGNRVISVRIKETTLAELDRIATEINYSRNELINLILEHGINNIEIESKPPVQPVVCSTPIRGDYWLDP